MRLQAPGFFDLQVNGFAGVDFNDPAATAEDIARALDALQLTGVTRCLPTLITSSFEDFARCARAVLATGHAAVAGLHMEGPYLAPEDGPRGAHPRNHARPASFDDFSRRQAAAEGRIRLVTLAPEVPGALPLIERLVELGVRVAIGHSAASTARIADAVSAGATLSTHLGNGCATTLPRHPNLLWAQLAEDRLRASLIVDGHHLPPETVKVMVRAKAPERCLLVTDATMCAGCPPGRYRLGALEVELSPEGRVQAPGGDDPGGLRPHPAAGGRELLPLRRPAPRGSAAPGGRSAGRLPGRGPARPARARVGRGNGIAPGRARHPQRFPST